MTVGLALSGGGALGVAHIGVLETLEAAGMTVDLIAGTSAGAILGLLYADGGLPAIHRFLDELTARGLLPQLPVPPLRPPGQLFKAMGECLRRTVHAATFDALPRPFCCVAADLQTGEMVTLDAGAVVPAVLASAAYPGVFPLQRVDGRILVDGGSVRNFPADVLRARGMEFVIGCSLYGIPRMEYARLQQPFSRLQTLLRAYEMMEYALSRLQFPFCDFCFTPPVESFRWFEFNRLPEILRIGREYALTRREPLLETYRRFRAARDGRLDEPVA